MTFFIVLGMIILFVIGLAAIVSGVVIPLYAAAWNGRFNKLEVIYGIILVCFGAWAWYFVFSHVSIGIG